MIKIYQKTIRDQKLKTLKKIQIGSWIYIENPQEKEIERINKDFSFDQSLIKDALDPHEVPRLEVEKEAVYIFTRIPHQEKNKVVTIPFLIVINDQFLATVCAEKPDFLEKFTSEKIDFSTTQKTRLFLQFFNEINQAFNNFLTHISKDVRSISVQLEKIENRDVMRFVGFEIILNDFLAALIPSGALLQNLLSGKFLKLYEKDRDLVEDLSLGTGQLIERCKTDLKNIVNIRESYSTIITNNLNRVIKLLTALTIILTVPTIIASIFGMNVDLPFATSPFAFFWIMGITLIFSFSLLFILFKKHWL